VFFSLFIIKIPKSSKRRSIEKEREREKSIEKREREKKVLKREREKKSIKKEEGKEKLQESLQIKWGSQYFERRKISQLQNLFTCVHFLPFLLVVSVLWIICPTR
jgi:hypothetical protein